MPGEVTQCPAVRRRPPGGFRRCAGLTLTLVLAAGLGAPTALAGTRPPAPRFTAASLGQLPLPVTRAAAAAGGGLLCAQVGSVAGFRGGDLVIAVAVGLAESGCDPLAEHANGASSGCPYGSVDRGLWQINSCYHPTVSNACAYDAQCNADVTFGLSNGGSDWYPWAAYTNGSYQEFLEDADVAVAELGARPPPADPPWSAWQLLGGALIGAPTAVSYGDQVDVFAVGTDHHLYETFDTAGGPFTGWFPVGPPVNLSPTIAAASYAGAVHVFAPGTANQLLEISYLKGWGSWTSLGGRLGLGPGAATGDGQLNVFAAGPAHRLIETFQNSDGPFTGWFRVTPTGTLGSPVSAVWSDNQVAVFTEGTNQRLYQLTYRAGWGSWVGLGGVLGAAPGAVAFDGQLDVFVRGTDDLLYEDTLPPGGGWTGWYGEGATGRITSAPAVVAPDPHHVDVFAVGTDGHLYELCYHN